MRSHEVRRGTLCKILAFFVTLFASLSAISAPVAQLVPSRTSGVAPLAVHFDAIGTTDSAGNFEPFRQYTYSFNFGDPGSGTWQFTGKSKNSHVGGPLTAHIYDDPGTYQVSLTVTDENGLSSSRQVTITVQNPDQVFSNTNTVCLSRNTNFSGCPSGAARIQNISSWPEFESNKRYLLRAGQDFRSLGNLVVEQVEQVQLNKFGSGSKPLLEEVWLQNSTRHYTGDWITDVRVINLAPRGVKQHITGFDLLIYKNTISGTDGEIHLGSAFGHHKNNNHYPGELFLPKNNFVVENVNFGPLEQAFGRGQQIWMGNHFNNAWEHNIRLWQVYKTVIAHNKLEGMGPNPGRPGRSNIKIHSTGLDPVNINQHKTPSARTSSQYLVASDNILGSIEDEGVWNTIAYKPQNSSEVEGMADAIFENNTLICSSLPGFKRTGTFGGRNITQRGPIVICNETGNALLTATSDNTSQLPSGWDGPYFIDEEVIGIPDSDGDGIANSNDNCPTVPNSSQGNFDGDSQGNVCDSDDDNDNMPDTWELAHGLNPYFAADASQDPDSDNLTNLQEYNGGTNPNVSNSGQDSDSDGVSDTQDNCPTVPNAQQGNFDGDSLGNACDPDDDNDGMPDTWETAYALNPYDASDANLDADGDGISNLSEFIAGTDPNEGAGTGTGTGTGTGAEFNLLNFMAILNLILETD